MLRTAPATFAGALTLDLAKWPNVATRAADDGLYAILGVHESWPIRLLIQGEIPDGAPLAALVPLDDDTPARLAASQRLWRILAAPRAPPEHDSITPMRRARYVFMLRAVDGRLAGATHRAIAKTLFQVRAMSAREWKGHSERSKTLRLVADAVELMRGGYFGLLRGRRR